LAFLPFVTNPELEGCIVTWDFMETIHSRSYTHIIKNLYSNPNEVFDTILKDDRIEKRAESVTKTYDDLINLGYKWHLNKDKVDLQELKKKMYLAMVSVNILEGLRFYVSFACSFAFGELKLLEGSAKIISMIARDESQHLAMSQTIINNWHDRNDDKDMIRIRKECEKEVYKMYDESLEEEKRWATYLFSQGSMIGLSEKLLHQFVEYMANRRMKAIGLTPQYEQKTNPLPWVDHWLNSKGMQNAPQETEIESYVIGGIKQDVEKDQFKKFKL
jgi:ribonucleoside-diphosphate reductase beta chain